MAPNHRQYSWIDPLIAVQKKGVFGTCELQQLHFNYSITFLIATPYYITAVNVVNVIISSRTVYLPYTVSNKTTGSTYKVYEIVNLYSAYGR